MANTAYSKPVKSFCPLILFHDNPSDQLYKTLTSNKQHDQTAINRHRHKINEMMELNAQYWTETFEETTPADIKVSPSTTSNISSCSSSSGDSISTIDRHHFYSEDKKKIIKASKSTPSTLDTSKKRRRGNLPKEVTEFLRKWLIQHKKHPYPAEKEKVDLARHTGLTVNQISNWFINARRRILQPMLESENLNAQFMTYPEMGFEQHRRKRSDFYTFQRDLPDSSSRIPMPASYSDDSMYHRRRLMDIDEQYQQLSMR